MSQPIHTSFLNLSMKLMNEISKVDRFDASWSQIEKREGQTLKQLKAIATIRSVGASTRIEGSRMTDAEVEVLIEKLSISKLEERDQQEVAGYFEALDTISESYRDIDITEGNLMNLHKILMSYTEVDKWHSGAYKRTSNPVAATLADGTKQVIYKTAEPGLETEEAMHNLLKWYHSDHDTIPVIKIALFVYEFLSIHPFQDGNGRLSRLIATLLLLRHGYSWIQYVSFEHEIENRKAEYYKVLMLTQKQRPGEDIGEWLYFFLDCMLKIQWQLMTKLSTQANNSAQAPREKNILAFLENYPGSKSSDIATKLNLPLSTVKKTLTALLQNKAIIKYGAGAGTNYMVETKSPLKANQTFQLESDNLKKEFLLTGAESFIEIKKIILTPLFPWVKPDEWTARLLQQDLSFTINCRNNRGDSVGQVFSILSLVEPNDFSPVFTLHSPIHIPLTRTNGMPRINEFPLQVEIDLYSSVKEIDFKIMFVYDQV